MKQIILKIINLTLILIVIGLGLWLVNINVPASGQLEINAVLGKDQRAISSLGPPPRLRLQTGYQEILENPVYFDLRSLRWFKQIRIDLVYQEGSRQLVGMAGKVGPDWQYLEKQPLAVLDLENGWKKATFNFESDALYSNKNIKRFLISTTGESGDVLKIKSIKIILNR